MNEIKDFLRDCENELSQHIYNKRNIRIKKELQLLGWNTSKLEKHPRKMAQIGSITIKHFQPIYKYNNDTTIVVYEEGIKFDLRSPTRLEKMFGWGD